MSYDDSSSSTEHMEENLGGTVLVEGLLFSPIFGPSTEMMPEKSRSAEMKCRNGNFIKVEQNIVR